MSKEMREQIDNFRQWNDKQLNENTLNLSKIKKIAKGVDFNTFLKKTDSLAFEYDMLYRGSEDELENNIFMTDYVGHAFEYGDIVNGILYNPNNEILQGHVAKDSGYKVFTPFKNKSVIKVHRLVGYQKYGEVLFDPDLECRHLDNDKLNNLDYNIVMGTHHENMMDIPKEERAINAGNQSRKYKYDKVKEYYRKVRSYKQTMEKFSITSKGTLNYILRT